MMNYKRLSIAFKITIYPRSITNNKVVEWIRSWANQQDKIITPGGTIILVNEQNTTNNQEFIYFILNSDSNAIKIGRAKDVAKRLNALQIANPIKLILLKTIEVSLGKKAKT